MANINDKSDDIFHQANYEDGNIEPVDEPQSN